MPENHFLFQSGAIVCTPGALRALLMAQTSAADLIERHLRGDFGEIDEEDRQRNLVAINEEGRRVLSRYRLRTQTVIWAITEADRSVTTLLLPDEY